MLYQLAFPEAEISVVPVEVYGINRVLGELSRCGNQFVSDIKEYLKQKGLEHMN